MHIYNHKSPILQLQNATTLVELQELLSSEEYDFRYDLGLGKPVNAIRLEDCEGIVSCMSNHYSILVVKAELDQLLGGLVSTLNVLSLIRENASQMRSLFVYSKPSALSADDLYDLLQPKLSPIGSNRQEAEEAAVMQWCDFLQVIESTYTSQYSHYK